METALATRPQETKVILYPVTADTLSARRDELLALKINGVDDEAGLATVKAKLREVVGWRTSVERTRKEAKDEYLKAGKRVDAQAEEIQALIAPIEAHLAKQKRLVDDERARIEQEQRDRIIDARIRRLTDIGVVGTIDRQFIGNLSEPAFEVHFENQSQVIADNKKRLEEDRERQRISNEQLEANRIESNRLAEEREQLNRERQQLEQQRIDNERAAQTLADRETERQLDEQLAAERERQRLQQIEDDRLATERAEALKPVRQQINDFASKIRLMPLPKIDEAICGQIDEELYACADRIEAIGKELK